MPCASVGDTVTVVPFTPTFRKWCTWESLVGRGAPPQVLPGVVEL